MHAFRFKLNVFGPPRANSLPMIPINKPEIASGGVCTTVLIRNFQMSNKNLEKVIHTYAVGNKQLLPTGGYGLDSPAQHFGKINLNCRSDAKERFQGRISHFPLHVTYHLLRKARAFCDKVHGELSLLSLLSQNLCDL
jgi:hypothetical protein